MPEFMNRKKSVDELRDDETAAREKVDDIKAVIEALKEAKDTLADSRREATRAIDKLDNRIVDKEDDLDRARVELQTATQALEDAKADAHELYTAQGE